MSHVKFVNWVARMPSSDKLCISFRAEETNGCLHFSFSLLAACDSVSWPCRMWPESKELRSTKGVSLLGRKVQLVGYFRELEGFPLDWDVGIL